MSSRTTQIFLSIYRKKFCLNTRPNYRSVNVVHELSFPFHFVDTVARSFTVEVVRNMTSRVICRTHCL